MLDLFGEFLEVAIPGAVLLGILYGLGILVRNIFRYIKSEISGDTGALSYEQKKKILNIIKIIIVAQMLGLLFYITPTINENIKIVISLVITLGAFCGTFFIKERIGYNGICRGLIFIGQEFFGITMFLIMINKGMGYSAEIIFGIWTVFNLYISKQFRKIENKIFFWGTLTIFLVLMLVEYMNFIDAYILVISLCVILLGVHLFGDENSIIIRGIYNTLITILMAIVVLTSVKEADKQIIIYFTMLIYMITMFSSAIVSRELNIKAFCVYIPFVVALLLVGFEIEMLWFFSIFSGLVSFSFSMDKGVYKKVLCAITLVCTLPFPITWAGIDTLISFIIYGSSIIFTFTYIFAPARPVKIEEGGAYDEE